MNSRLLARLDAEIAVTAPGEELDILLAERSAYLARLGYVVTAREEVDALRARLIARPSAKVSALAQIADGLCHYYTDMGPAARDRFLRAHALARAACLDDVVARAASWLALLQYGAHQFADMASSLTESFSGRSLRDPGMLARSCLVVGQTVHLANRFDLALSWYRRARQLSAEIEDEATISALLHNMASIWATNSRNAVLGGPSTTDSSRQALAGALSTLNFDELVGLTNLSILTPLLRAQICSVEGDSDQALALYDEHLDALSVKGAQGWRVWLLADKAWCQLEVGRVQAARKTLGVAEGLLGEGMHADDQAAAHARLAAAYDRLGAATAAHLCRQRASECWRHFVDLQELMLSAIESSSGVKWMALQRP